MKNFQAEFYNFDGEEVGLSQKLYATGLREAVRMMVDSLNESPMFIETANGGVSASLVDSFYVKEVN